MCLDVVFVEEEIKIFKRKENEHYTCFHWQKSTAAAVIMVIADNIIGGKINFCMALVKGSVFLQLTLDKLIRYWLVD